MAGQKIRIRLKSYDHEVIDQSAKKIVETVTNAGATVVGPVPLPTEKNVFCVIRSLSQVQGFSRALRDAHSQAPHRHRGPDPQGRGLLMHIDLPADVNIEIKL
ncbi:MAG: 30S ribosomal protein S10 [Bifidobacterium sp.]